MRPRAHLLIYTIFWTQPLVRSSRLYFSRSLYAAANSSFDIPVPATQFIYSFPMVQRL